MAVRPTQILALAKSFVTEMDSQRHDNHTDDREESKSEFGTQFRAILIFIPKIIILFQYVIRIFAVAVPPTSSAPWKKWNAPVTSNNGRSVQARSSAPPGAAPAPRASRSAGNRCGSIVWDHRRNESYGGAGISFHRAAITGMPAGLAAEPLGQCPGVRHETICSRNETTLAGGGSRPETMAANDAPVSGGLVHVQDFQPDLSPILPGSPDGDAAPSLDGFGLIPGAVRSRVEGTTIAWVYRGFGRAFQPRNSIAPLVI